MPSIAVSGSKHHPTLNTTVAFHHVGILSMMFYQSYLDDDDDDSDDIHDNDDLGGDADADDDNASADVSIIIDIIRYELHSRASALDVILC